MQGKKYLQNPDWETDGSTAIGGELKGKITSILIHDIERLDDRGNTSADLTPGTRPISHDFRNSPVIEELALAQHVRPSRMFGRFSETGPWGCGWRFRIRNR